MRVVMQRLVERKVQLREIDAPEDTHGIRAYEVPGTLPHLGRGLNGLDGKLFCNA